MSYMSENFVYAPLGHHVDVDTNGDVVLYLDGNAEADRLVITMSREQFRELARSMQCAANTDLPDFSRWRNGELRSRAAGFPLIDSMAPAALEVPVSPAVAG